MNFAPQAVSSTDTSQEGMREHENLIPDNVSQRGGNQCGGPQQTLDLGLLETASQSSADSSHTTLADGSQSTQEPCSPSLVGDPAISGSEGLVHDRVEERIIPRPPISELLSRGTCIIIIGGTTITLAVLRFFLPESFCEMACYTSFLFTWGLKIRERRRVGVPHSTAEFLWFQANWSNSQQKRAGRTQTVRLGHARFQCT